MSRWTNILKGIASSMLALPLVSAATGINMLDDFFVMIGEFFYVEALMSNRIVQIGVFKALYFFLMFAVVRWVLDKYVFNKDGSDASGKRTSIVAAAVFGLIASLLMPPPMAMATASGIMLLFGSLIPIIIAGGAAFVAFKLLNKEWWQHLIGIGVLILAQFLLLGFLNVFG